MRTFFPYWLLFAGPFFLFACDTGLGGPEDAHSGDEDALDDGSGGDHDGDAPLGDSQTRIRFNPKSKAFYDQPWPSHYLMKDGKIDLQNFPNPDEQELLQHYQSYGSEVLDGWGTNSAFYFGLTAPIDEESLPDDLESLEDPLSPVQLINVSPKSRHFLERTPLVLKQITESEDPYYDPPLLAGHMVYGFPLEGASEYCAVLLSSLRGEDGKQMSQDPDFIAAFHEDAAFSSLRKALPQLAFKAQQLVGATCFQTQDPTRDMKDIEAFLESYPTEDAKNLTLARQNTLFYEFTGTYLAPNFQQGEKPYGSEGGDFQFDEDRKPLISEIENLRVRLVVPKNRAMPDKGWPVILYSHGTGGDWESCLGSGQRLVLQEGFAMLCIDQPLHGPRNYDPSRDVNELDVFNYFNPASGRTSFRQSAADTLWLSRMVEDGRFNLPQAATPFPEDLRLDPQNIAYFGHSHGGLAGSIVLAIDPRIKGGVLSGNSGVLIETIIRRKDPLDIQGAIALLLRLDPRDLDTFHPVLNLTQLLIEVADPINFSPHWFNAPFNEGRRHIFMTEGTADAYSPAVGADAVAAAAHMPQIEPIVTLSRAHVLRGLAPVGLPLQNNVTFPNGDQVTAGLRQFEDGDHWVALYDAGARRMFRSFFRTLRSKFSPIIQD